MIHRNFKFGQFIVIPMKILTAPVEKLDGGFKYELLALTSPPVSVFEYSFRPWNLLDDPTCDYLACLEIKTFDRILSISRRSQSNTSVRTWGIIVRNNFFSGSLHVRTKIGPTVFVVVNLSTRD